MTTSERNSLVKNASLHNELWIRLTAFIDSKAETSKKSYVSIIKEWCEFLGVEPGTQRSATRIISVNDLDVASYLAWLRKRPGIIPRLTSSSKISTPEVRKKNINNDGLSATLTNKTINKKFSVLRKIYKVLMRSNLGVTKNPFENDLVTVPSSRAGEKRPTEMISFTEVKDLIDKPDISIPVGRRDKALLSILFGGGLRRSEARNLRLGDIKKTQKGNVFLHLRSTKAKTDADQALPEWAAVNLLEYAQERMKQGALNGDYCFVRYKKKGSTQTDTPMSETEVYRTFKKYCLLAGVSNYASPHSARATAITKLLEDGFSHRKVKEFSRHSSVEMVELYDKRRYSIDENPAIDLNFTKKD